MHLLFAARRLTFGGNCGCSRMSSAGDAGSKCADLLLHHAASLQQVMIYRRCEASRIYRSACLHGLAAMEYKSSESISLSELSRFISLSHKHRTVEHRRGIEEKHILIRKGDIVLDE